MKYLVDTGVLLRAFDSRSFEHEDVVKALRILRDRSDEFAVTVQNLAEFWNVSTRPVENNGYGLPVGVVSRRIQIIERFCTLYTENLVSVEKWKQLGTDLGLSGVSVHDARLVSVMLAFDIPRILTLNVKDFTGYKAVEAISPKDVVASASQN
jgi:predicted nucleic acid-binding protein